MLKAYNTHLAVKMFAHWLLPDESSGIELTPRETEINDTDEPEDIARLAPAWATGFTIHVKVIGYTRVSGVDISISGHTEWTDITFWIDAVKVEIEGETLIKPRGGLTSPLKPQAPYAIVESNP